MGINKQRSPVPPETAKRFTYWQWRTILATMVGYTLFYFLRKNFSFAMPGMESELGITKTNLGLFLTRHGLVYGLSKFVNGFWSDGLKSRRYLTSGLTLCLLVNVAFGFGPLLASQMTGAASGPAFMSALVAVFGILWVLNGLFQGAGFPPCARLIAYWVPPGELATKMSIWNTSHSIGAGLISVLCGYIMMCGGAGAWRFCFWMPAAIAGAGLLFLFAALRDTPSSVGLPELSGTEVRGTCADGLANLRFLRERIFCNPVIWTLGVANFAINLVRFAVLDWGPTMLKESKGVSLGHAGWMVAAFEIAGVAGMLSAGWVTDRFMKGRAPRTCVFYMAGAALGMFAFWNLPPASPTWLLFATLLAAGFFVYGPQALTGVTATNIATKRLAGTAIGFISLFSYASVVVSGVGLGALAQHCGWRYAYLGMTGVAVVGVAVFLTLWNVKAQAYDELNDVRAKSSTTDIR
jgi:OPA family glycerol-3-phosphate transporter-like MFS transporter/OPA family sugar phosphate sensor protein UhpC-like MFS transporter